MSRNRKNRKSKNQGFSLVELTVAMFVLAVGVLGGMVMIITGMTRDNTNRVDTTATNAAQAVLEEIAGAPAQSSPTLSVTDCLGNVLAINTAGSASPGSGAPLQANGDIDFSQGAVPGYQMNYTVCGTTTNIQTVYDVRWHVTMVGPGNSGKLVVVSARQPFVASSKGIGLITPVTLRTIVGM
ncbi:MAG TPA: prepilin-type N-terminal cleavage/methylation domain-containing protein [Candidatus Angelobacter sp.]|jgi:prepilin-type N-terminal cleavage/methylation domain-containing protein|nr:prepilin-type N-terminal cleavage/methylation domain-containing protein [Candidatus Angelobacter sp.]HWG41131.1 prepilin-type N-terminal cleavage/methylation domain-containing protein [Candidatus Acidoferrales bacterium]